MSNLSDDSCHLLVSAVRDTRHEDWDVRAVNLLQAAIGCVHGFVPLDHLAIDMARIGGAPTAAQDLFFRGVVLHCVMRATPNLSPAEALRLTRVIDEIGKMAGGNFKLLVAELRHVTRATGPGVSSLIREYIDAHYATKLQIGPIAEAFAMNLEDAEAEFRQQFRIGTHEYQIRRRVEEGVALVQAGAKVEAAAREVGWNGERHFYDHVRELMGTTPAAFRSRSPRLARERGSARAREKGAVKRLQRRGK